VPSALSGKAGHRGHRGHRGRLLPLSRPPSAVVVDASYVRPTTPTPAPDARRYGRTSAINNNGGGDEEDDDDNSWFTGSYRGEGSIASPSETKNQWL
jgi:hypothetical protein